MVFCSYSALRHITLSSTHCSSHKKTLLRRGYLPNRSKAPCVRIDVMAGEDAGCWIYSPWRAWNATHGTRSSASHAIFFCRSVELLFNSMLWYVYQSELRCKERILNQMRVVVSTVLVASLSLLASCQSSGRLSICVPIPLLLTHLARHQRNDYSTQTLRNSFFN